MLLRFVLLSWVEISQCGVVSHFCSLPGACLPILPADFSCQIVVVVVPNAYVCPMRIPTIAFVGLFSGFDCAIQGVRGVESPVNAIASGALTGGVLAARSGPRAAGKSALVGGFLLALIEGMGIMLTRMMANVGPTPEEIEKMRAEMEAAREKGAAVPEMQGGEAPGGINFWSPGASSGDAGLAGVGQWGADSEAS